jgi:hypothetical protein
VWELQNNIKDEGGSGQRQIGDGDFSEGKLGMAKA